MQDEVDFEKLTYLLPKLQSIQDGPNGAEEEMLDIFIACYFVKYSHQNEKNIVKKT